MAKVAPGLEIPGTVEEEPAVAKGGHGGSAVKQGMKGQSVRTEERGRDEFSGSGDSAALDTGRASEGGRHYGRATAAEPPPASAAPEPIPTGTVTFPPDRPAEPTVAGRPAAKSPNGHKGRPSRR